jgi:hypothetical protein
MNYNNSIGTFIGDIFQSSKKKKEIETLQNLANQPATISPYIFIVPAVAIGVFVVIYAMVLKK